MQFLDEIKLGFGHNLLLGNIRALPKILTLEQFSEAYSQEIIKAKKTSIEKFGLFDAATPNYTTYYPDATAKDLNPTDDEFIEPVFRALSEVIVHKSWNPIDFSMNGILKKSMNRLMGQTVNADHETALGNAMGAVSDVSWQEAAKVDGVLVPAGINAALKIDGKSNPRIARQIMMDPPGIHSTSVTVGFMWEKSHADYSESDFFNKLGSFDKDGKMIRRIATEVKQFREISLVGHGADPFAMKIGADGKIVNPKYAGIAYNSETDRQQAQGKYNKTEKYFFFDNQYDLISNSEDPTIPPKSKEEETIENKNTDMKQIALFLKLAEDATEAQILQKLNELNAAATTAASEITRLTAAAPDATKLTELQSFKDTAIQAKRDGLVALYNKTTKTPDASTVALIAKANVETIDLLSSQYGAEVERLYPAKCKKCGSTELSRSSADTKDENKDEHKEDTRTLQEKLRDRQKGNEISYDRIGGRRNEVKK